MLATVAIPDAAAALGNAYWWPTLWLLALQWIQDRQTSWLTDMTDQEQILGT